MPFGLDFWDAFAYDLLPNRLWLLDRSVSGDDALMVPPVPIPNTAVKHQEAESTWLETAREDR